MKLKSKRSRPHAGIAMPLVDPAASPLDGRVGEVMTPVEKERFPRLAATNSGKELWEILGDKLRDGEIEKGTAIISHDLVARLDESNRRSGPETKRARAEAQFKAAPDWRETATAEWQRQRDGNESLATLGDMAAFIWRGLTNPEADRPSPSMIKGAIQGHKPTRTGRLHKGPKAK